MKHLVYTLSLLCLTLVSCQTKTKDLKAELTPSKVSVYYDDITLGNDKRQLFFEFNRDNPSLSRWGIENAGRHRIPFINSHYNTSTKTFSGDLTFFGDHISGSISVSFRDNDLKGQLVWHKDTVSVNLKEMNRNLSYYEEDLSFSNGTTQLKGTLILPKHADTKSPLVVFVSGSGCSTRWWGMYWANELSKIGVASLLYDKRGCGASTGVSWTNSSLDDLANDVISGINALKNHPKIDHDKIGMYGVSQGGWIAGRVNGITGKDYFIIANSGGGVSPYEEEVFSYDLYMKYSGIDKKGLEEGNATVKRYLNYLGTGQNRSELEAALRANQDKEWFPILGLDRILVSEKNRKNWEWVATYEPSQDIKQIKAPVLVLLGGQDYQQPTTVSSEKWKQALEAANNTNYTIKIFEEAGHALTIGGHHSRGFPKYAEGHIDLIKDFLLESVLRK